MPLTEIQVANRSLALIGADPITSFEDDSIEAQHCNTLYEGTAQFWLCKKPWRFAVKQAELDLLSAVPLARWDAAYQAPSDLLRLLAVTINDYPVIYDRYDDMIYCNANQDDTLVADYIYRADESLWLPYFTQGFVFIFAGLLGGALARDADLVDKYTKLGTDTMAQAGNIEAQSQTTRHIRLSRYLKVRGNSQDGGFRDDGY